MTDDVEFAYGEIAGFECVDGEGSVDSIFDALESLKDCGGGEELQDLVGREGEMVPQGGEFAAVVEEVEEVVSLAELKVGREGGGGQLVGCGFHAWKIVERSRLGKSIFFRKHTFGPQTDTWCQSGWVFDMNKSEKWHIAFG